LSIAVRAEAVRVALTGFAVATACDGCPPLQTLVARYAAAGGRYLAYPICFDARNLDVGNLIDGAELGGAVPMWQWIGDDNAVPFSY
jgi:hypothetical protein